MQKIVMVHPNLFERGGAERKLILISKELIRLGYKVDIVVREYDKNSTFYELIDDELTVMNLNQKSKLKWFVEVVKVLIKNKYDLVVVHNYPANIPVGIFNFVFNKNIKSIWVCNEVATLLERKKGLFWKTYYRIEQYLAKYFDLIIANSSFTASSIDNYFNTKSKVIRSGVEIREVVNEDNVSNEIKSLVKSSYVFSLSRIEKHKNIEFLEKISKQLVDYDVRIIVAGKGNDSLYLNELEKKYKNIIYVGAINEDEKFFLYRYAKIFLFLPKAEPLGVTTMESLSQNTPVVAYNNGGPKEIILDRKNGFLSNNDEEYLENIKYMLNEDHKITDGKEYIQENFSNKRMIDDFVRVFKETLKG